MTKEGYQPIKTKKTTKIIPPNTGSHVRMEKDGYTWEDLDKAWWEGFDNAKNKMDKRIAELEREAEEQAKKLEENQTLGVYDREEDLEYDKGWNAGEVSGFKDGYIAGAEPREKRIAELEKAKEIITYLLHITNENGLKICDVYGNPEMIKEAEAFIK